MERLLLLDVSYGPTNIIEEAGRNPLVVIALFAVAALLLYFGVRLILRELKKKKGRLAGERQPAEEMPAVEENQPVPEADQADHTENKEE